jgi:hypothetical protein
MGIQTEIQGSVAIVKISGGYSYNEMEQVMHFFQQDAAKQLAYILYDCTEFEYVDQMGGELFMLAFTPAEPFKGNIFCALKPTVVHFITGVAAETTGPNLYFDTVEEGWKFIQTQE